MISLRCQRASTPASSLITWVDGQSWPLLCRMSEASPVSIAIVGADYISTRTVVEYELSKLPGEAKSPPIYNRTRLTITWPNGSTVRLFTAHHPEHMRGIRFDYVAIIDRARWPGLLGDRCMENIVESLRRYP